MVKDHRDAFCSYCRKSYVEVGPLIEGPADNLYICSDCVDLCRSILDQEELRRKQRDPSSPTISTVERLRQHLGRCFNLETTPLRALLSSIDRHVESLSSGSTPAKSLILLAGPSTAAALFVTKLVASALETKFWLVERKRFLASAALFEPDSAIFEFLKRCDFDVEDVHRSIAFVERFDERTSQDALSHMLHGRGDEEKLAQMSLDLRKMLFVCAGAFAERSGCRTDASIDPADLIAWGVLPDLVERLHVALWWDSLDEHTLYRIAAESDLVLPARERQETPIP